MAPAGAQPLAAQERPANALGRRGLRLAGWLVTLTAAVAIVAAVALMAGPRLLGWQGVIVLSGSMEPALKVGGIAFVEPVSAQSVQVGDIITYRSLRDPRQQISHRVVEIVNDGQGLRFRTKGDANEQPDQALVPAGNLVGKVRFDLPYLGYATNKLRHPEMFYLIMGIPAALLVANEMHNIFRELRRRKEAAS